MALIALGVLVAGVGAWKGHLAFRHRAAEQEWQRGGGYATTNPRQAAAHWQRAIELDPGFSPPYLDLADLYVSNGRWSEAISLLGALNKKRPETPHLLCRLALAEVGAGQLAGAVQTGKAAVQREPDCARAQYALGRTLYELEDEAGALEHLRTALRIDPNHPDAPIYLAQSLIATMKLPEACEVLIRYITRIQSNPHAYYLLGYAYARRTSLADYQEIAEGYFQQALDLDARHGGALTEIGRLRLLRHDAQGAAAALERALEITPDFKPALYLMARAYTLLGRDQEAEATFQRYQEILHRETSQVAGQMRAARSSTPLRQPPMPPPTTAPPSEPSEAAPLFVDVALAAGINFVHYNGATGRRYFLESTGSGCAFLDYDNDGWLDILLLQSGDLPSGCQTPAEPVYPRLHSQRHRGNGLYHNNGDGSFTEVTAESGIDRTPCAQGVAVGDYDNDGFDDLYITTYGPNHLFHNEGGSGRFRDVSDRAGVTGAERGDRYSLSAVWVDVDNDGDLDLLVCHYAHWSPETDVPCFDSMGNSAYCHPQVYDPDGLTLYQNEGDGRFTDVTAKAGIAGVQGRCMGAVPVDYDGDGWEDVYIAADQTANFLLHNNGDGTFEETGMQAGVAFSDNGQPLAGMGVAAGDYDNDGAEDLLVTNFSREGLSLYHNEGGGVFIDQSFGSHLATLSSQFLGFGCEFIDYDADGCRDILIANGHVMDNVHLTEHGVTYAEPKSLYRNQGDGTYAAVTERLGDLRVPRVSRGLALGDYDNDGDLDVLVNNQNARAQLLQNRCDNGERSITFRTTGRSANRDGYQTKITIVVGGSRRFAEMRANSSYCSSSDPVVWFGVGTARRVDQAFVQWSSGLKEELGALQAGQVYHLTEGKGVTASRPFRSMSRVE